MRRFLVLWFGAMINALGSGMTAFGVAAIAFQSTGSATVVSALLGCALVPPMLLGPITGVAADRYDRRLLMALGDGGGIGGLAIVWWAVSQPDRPVAALCAGMLISGLFAAISEPAFKASVTDLVDPDDYARSSALLQLTGAGRLLLAPLAAGVLLALASIEAVLAIDAATVVVTVAATMVVRSAISRSGPAATVDQSHASGASVGLLAGVVADLREGARTVGANHGITRLISIFVLTTFAAGLAQVLLKPLMLPRISISAQGVLESVMASGLIAGSAVVAFVTDRWGSYRALVAGLVAGGGFLAALPYGDLWWAGLTGFCFFGALALINTGADVLVRTTLPNETQGRAWGLIGLVSQLGFPFAFVVAGPLADLVFDPLVAADGPMAGSVGRLTGVGPGRGVSLIFTLAGLMIVGSGVVVGRSPSVAALEPPPRAESPAEPTVSPPTESTKKELPC